MQITSLLRSLFLFVALVGAWTTELVAQPQRLADIRTENEPTSFSPGGPIQLPSGDVIFTNSEDDYGMELWIAQASGANAEMLKDINVGPGASSPGGFELHGDRVFFVAFDPATGRELWVTDGTPAGTQLYSDICPGGRASDPEQLTSSGSQLYLVAECDHGKELYVTEGTGLAPTLMDIASGPTSSWPGKLTPRPGGGVYFSAFTEFTGRELYSSSGVGTTQLEVNMSPGADGSTVWELEVLSTGEVVMGVRVDGSGWEFGVWEPVGQTFTFFEIQPGLTGSNASKLVVRGNEVYFRAKVPGAGQELFRWRSGDPSLTFLTDLNSGPGDGICSNNRPIVPHGAYVYVLGDDGTTGCELFRIDPSGGQPMSWEVNAGPQDGGVVSIYSDDNDLYMTSCELGSGCIWWRLDGVTLDTVAQYPTALGLSVDAHIHGAAWGEAEYDERWDTLLTMSGQTPSPIASSTTTDSKVSILSEGRHSTEIFFRADNDLGREPWLAPALGSPFLIEDLSPGPDNSTPLDAVGGSGTVTFSTASPREVRVWDGGPVETIDVDLLSDAFPRNLEPFQDVVLALANVPGSSSELVAFDPVNRSWEQLTDGSGFGEIGPVAAGESALFVYRVGSDSRLWSTDGTPSGTVDLGDASFLSGQTFGATIRPETGIGDLLFVFSAYDPATGTELHVTDGTPSGTQLLADLQPGTASSRPQRFMQGPGNRAAFIAFPVANDPAQLFVTDGTPSGTVQLTNRTTTTEFIYLLGTTSGGWFFTDYRDDVGFEVWFTDGTAVGTIPLDIVPGPGWSVTDDNFGRIAFTSDGDNGYFPAWTPADGNELWKSDGTPAGTIQLDPLLPGSAGHEDQEPSLFYQGGILYFSANGMDGAGSELWADPLGTLLFRDGFESGDTSQWSPSQ